MRKIFIGDVHGLVTELQELLKLLDVRQGDEVVFVGDLLDKGPHSTEVVEEVLALAERTKVVLVKGNHEWRHERFRRKMAEVGFHEAMKMKGSEELLDITDRLGRRAASFLEQAPVFHRTGDYLVVHGGIPGTMKDLPQKAQTSGLSGRERAPLELMMMTRFLGRESGKMLPLGTEGKEDPFWAEVYDGRFGRVVFGHQPFIGGPKIFPHAVGIDTGAVFGGKLTAMVSEGGEEKFFSVQAGKAWSELISED